MYSDAGGFSEWHAELGVGTMRQLERHLGVRTESGGNHLGGKGEGFAGGGSVSGALPRFFPAFVCELVRH